MAGWQAPISESFRNFPPYVTDLSSPQLSTLLCAKITHPPPPPLRKIPSCFQPAGVTLVSVHSSPNDQMLWALDSRWNVHVRLGITEEMPVGTAWEHVPGRDGQAHGSCPLPGRPGSGMIGEPVPPVASAFTPKPFAALLGQVTSMCLTNCPWYEGPSI